MSQPNDVQQCLNCNRTENQIPLVTLRYQGEAAFVCSQCMPVLIHQPEMLVGKLSGAEKLSGAPHHHD